MPGVLSKLRHSGSKLPWRALGLAYMALCLYKTARRRTAPDVPLQGSQEGTCEACDGKIGRLLPRQAEFSPPVRLLGIVSVLLLQLATEWKSIRKGGSAALPQLTPKFLRVLAHVPFEAWRLIFSSAILTVIGFAERQQPQPYTAAFLLPMMTFANALQGRFWTLIVYTFLVFPMLEIVSGVERSNPTREECKALDKKFSFRAITMAWAPLQALLLLWATWATTKYPFSLGQLLCFAASIGINTGALGINIAHELIHKSVWLEKVLGRLLLCSVFYGHFETEHLLGHHKNVATLEDPATARFNESFYAFLPRSVIGGFLSAWRIEKKRHGTAWTFRNTVLQNLGISALMAAGVRKLFGPRALALFLVQSGVAISMLELVNYIEHYGILRRRDPRLGDTQPVNITHSWNSDARVTGYLLFRLQNHSDHHAYAKRRYQILRSFPQSLHMPTGYAGMISLALIPRLFFRVMNPLVEQSEAWGNHIWRGGSSAEIPEVQEKFCLCQPDSDGTRVPT